MMRITFRNIAAAGKVSLFLAFLAAGVACKGQESIDKIIAVVGKEIILQSELEMQFIQLKQQNPATTDTMRCDLLQGMIMDKLLKAQAERDSVLVSDEDVEGQMENRLRYFIQMYGSKEKLEQLSGKTIYQMKEEYRDGIRDRMIVEKMQGQILEHVKVTPAEVEAFYNKIPKDSLPFFPATVEVGQIVVDAPVSQEMMDYAHDKLEEIRKDIVDGKKTFEGAVAVYSQDPGSRDNGGRYDGVTRNGPWAPEFISAAFKLQNGELSPIFKTKFGYHIIKMIHRKGDEADLAHILIKPEVTSSDFKKAMEKLDSIRSLLVTGKMAFPEAVGKFSTDEGAKRTGGMIADPNTGSTVHDISKLDAGMVLLLDSLEQGEYSAPHIYLNEMQDKSCRIVYLRTRTTPHRANLKDDYGKLQEVALSQKKSLRMINWLRSILPTYYVKVDPAYQNCPGIRDWYSASLSAK